MKSLFVQAGANELIQRINSLSSESKAVWGKMNVSQMLVHTQAPLKVAFGELKLKRGLLGILFGGMVKKQLTGSVPFKRNSPTDKQFLVTGTPDFVKEQKKLVELVSRFALEGPQAITSEPHPFFGKMTPQEWDILQWKHLDHHLRQFGA